MNWMKTGQQSIDHESWWPKQGRIPESTRSGYFPALKLSNNWFQNLPSSSSLIYHNLTLHIVIRTTNAIWLSPMSFHSRDLVNPTLI